MASVAVRPQNRAPSANMFSVKKLILQNRRSCAAIAHCTLVDCLLMRATGAGLHALRRRQALARRRQTFIARGAGERIAAGANQRRG